MKAAGGFEIRTSDRCHRSRLAEREQGQDRKRLRHNSRQREQLTRMAILMPMGTAG